MYIYYELGSATWGSILLWIRITTPMAAASQLVLVLTAQTASTQTYGCPQPNKRSTQGMASKELPTHHDHHWLIEPTSLRRKWI